MKINYLILLILISNTSLSLNFVTLDFSINDGQVWDNLGDSNNMISNCVLGDKISGFEWINLKVETIGISSFNEANMYFSDSLAGSNGVIINPGSTSTNSGTAIFNSNGILNLSDFGISDIVSLSDKKFKIEFFDDTVDYNNMIEARFTSGILKVWGQNLSIKSDCEFGHPDIYEEDDTISTTTNIIAINGSKQHHNFQDDTYDTIILPSNILSHFGLNQYELCPNLSCKIEVSNLENVDLCIGLLNENYPGPYPVNCSINNYFLSDNIVGSYEYPFFGSLIKCSSQYTHIAFDSISSTLGFDKKYDVRLICTNNPSSGGNNGGGNGGNILQQ